MFSQLLPHSQNCCPGHPHPSAHPHALGLSEDYFSPLVYPWNSPLFSLPSIQLSPHQ